MPLVRPVSGLTRARESSPLCALPHYLPSSVSVDSKDKVFYHSPTDKFSQHFEGIPVYRQGSYSTVLPFLDQPQVYSCAAAWAKPVAPPQARITLRAGELYLTLQVFDGHHALLNVNITNLKG